MTSKWQYLVFLGPYRLFLSLCFLCFNHREIKKSPKNKIDLNKTLYSCIMLLLVRSEVPGSSGYLQMSPANWSNPSQWPFERLEVRCFIAGIVFKNMTVRDERRIMSRAFGITATKERGGENTMKKNMSFSK